MTNLRTQLSRTVVALALVAAAVGCAGGDAGLAPTAATAPDAATALAISQDVSLLGFQEGRDTLVGRWYIPANASSVQKVGAHMVTFPARAVCDPATTAYGPTQWDAPCTPATQTVVLTARAWMDADNNMQISFSPDVRFVPSDDPSRWVMLYIKEKSATDLSLLDRAVLSILWKPTSTAAGIDEAVSDATLRTQASPLSGYVWRRVKHFSGYTVAAGRTATDEPTTITDAGL